MLVFFWMVLIVVLIFGILKMFKVFNCFLNVCNIVGIVFFCKNFFVVLFKIGCLLKNKFDSFIILVV